MIPTQIIKSDRERRSKAWGGDGRLPAWMARGWRPSGWAPRGVDWWNASSLAPEIRSAARGDGVGGRGACPLLLLPQAREREECSRPSAMRCGMLRPSFPVFLLTPRPRARRRHVASGGPKRWYSDTRVLTAAACFSYCDGPDTGAARPGPGGKKERGQNH